MDKPLRAWGRIIIKHGGTEILSLGAMSSVQLARASRLIGGETDVGAALERMQSIYRKEDNLFIASNTVCEYIVDDIVFSFASKGDKEAV